MIKKFDFPTLPSYIEAQKEDRMAHMVNQVVSQAFISHASIMANSVHNVVVKTLQEGGLQGFVGPAYQQARQMIFAPTGSATTVPPVIPQTQTEGNVGLSQPIVRQCRLISARCSLTLHQWPHMGREVS